MIKQTEDFFDTFKKQQDNLFTNDKILSEISKTTQDQGGLLSGLNQLVLEENTTSSVAQDKSNLKDDVKNNFPLITEVRDITLENDINSEKYFFQNFEVKFLKGSESSLFFSDLVDRLKELSFPLNDCMLFCWDEKRGMHVFVANDPMTKPYFLTSNYCGVQKGIYIKFRSYKQQPVQQFQYGNGQKIQNNNSQQASIVSINPSIKEEDQINSDDNTTLSNQNSNINGNNGADANGKVSRKKKNHSGRSSNDKRVKERFIEKVREKVSDWRALHDTGFRDKDGNLQKLNLDQAASYIGISRKTLDDYFLQLRLAEQFGFDFEKYKGEKMGILRKYVKEEKKKQSKKNQANSVNSGGSANFDNNPNANNLSGCDGSDDDDDSSQGINYLNLNTISSKKCSNNSNNSKNIKNITNGKQINQQETTNQLFSQQKSNNNQNQTIHPSFNYQNSYTTNGINNNLNSFGQNNSNHSNTFMPTQFGHRFSQGHQNNFNFQEQMNTGIESLQRNSNSINFNQSINNSMFNTSGQLFNNNHGNNHFGNSNINDFNNILGDGMNGGNNVSEQRLSNHLLRNSISNNQQMIDERNSLNFMNNHNNIPNAENRYSNGSYINMEENYITTNGSF